jgi:cysteinyl-tRNA synthetase
LEEYEGAVLRMMILNSSYRSPITFNEQTIQHAEKALKRLRSALKPAIPQEGWKTEKEEKLKKAAAIVKDNFQKAMDDDFNTAGALGHIFDYVKDINQARDEGATQESLTSAQHLLEELTAVFGLNLGEAVVKEVDVGTVNSIIFEINRYLTETGKTDMLDDFKEEIYSSDIPSDIDVSTFQPDDGAIDYQNAIDGIVALREKARERKDWESSDHIRNVLNSSDIVVEDTDQGSTWYME